MNFGSMFDFTKYSESIVKAATGVNSQKTILNYDRRIVRKEKR
jgi:hypothetical protein